MREIWLPWRVKDDPRLWADCSRRKARWVLGEGGAWRGFGGGSRPGLVKGIGDMLVMFVDLFSGTLTFHTRVMFSPTRVTCR